MNSYITKALRKQTSLKENIKQKNSSLQERRIQRKKL